MDDRVENIFSDRCEMSEAVSGFVLKIRNDIEFGLTIHNILLEASSRKFKRLVLFLSGWLPVRIGRSGMHLA